MAKKKYYAIRKGLKTGIVETWEECQALITGYSNAEYKSFASMEEAVLYLGNSSADGVDKQAQTKEEFDLSSGELIAYVDGSYSDSLQKYSFGCVIITPDGEIIQESGNGNQPDSLAIRNVAGEMLGAMYAVKWGMVNGYQKIEIRYDYAGIEHWVTGTWKTKNKLTGKYAEAMNNWKSKIGITFRKIAAHSGNFYNDEADRLAKEALITGNGIPKVKLHPGSA